MYHLSHFKRKTIDLYSIDEYVIVEVSRKRSSWINYLQRVSIDFEFRLLNFIWTLNSKIEVHPYFAPRLNLFSSGAHAINLIFAFLEFDAFLCRLNKWYEKFDSLS